MTTTTTPRRVQFTLRQKGHTLPPGVKLVGRTSRWGNPYKVEKVSDGWRVNGVTYTDQAAAHTAAVELFRAHVAASPRLARQIPVVLAGRDLACNCALHLPCHADVLLELANGGAA